MCSSFPLKGWKMLTPEYTVEEQMPWESSLLQLIKYFKPHPSTAKPTPKTSKG